MDQFKIMKLYNAVAISAGASQWVDKPSTTKEILEKLTQIYEGNEETKENKLTVALQKNEAQGDHGYGWLYSNLVAKYGCRVLFGYACWKFYAVSDATSYWEKPDLSCEREAFLLRFPAVDSSDGRENGNDGLLLPRRFFSYLFSRLWVARWVCVSSYLMLCLELFVELEGFRIWLLGTAFVIIIAQN
ncbi:glycosyltransferase family protein 47 [Dorcoceras hygrometricum]|uniref:Glycosyltransferase family protein 47 n=1 Tax=Dorcoceras hygrometricum TaxID=472368 RepID=A0A2Z7CZZ4_9LAMI|nr:glycosyltransferase family protein 47 [Dorcoceras hygrometricum]